MGLRNDGLCFDRGWLEQWGLMAFQGMGRFVIRVQGMMSCGVRMSIRTPILPFHSPHPNIPLHIAIPRFISSSLLSSSSSATSILSNMSSNQFQNGSQVGVSFLGLCLKLADFGDALRFLPFSPLLLLPSMRISLWRTLNCQYALRNFAKNLII